jgi:hypothetical protein
LLEVPGDRHRPGIEPLCAELAPHSNDPLTDLLRGPGRVRPRPPGTGLPSVQAPRRYRARRRCTWRRENPCSAADSVTDNWPDTTLRTATRARDMLAKEPHPAAAPGDRRYGLALLARPPGRPPHPDETHVPTHEGRITWDICREPRHPLSAYQGAALGCSGRAGDASPTPATEPSAHASRVWVEKPPTWGVVRHLLGAFTGRWVCMHPRDLGGSHVVCRNLHLLSTGIRAGYAGARVTLEGGGLFVELRIGASSPAQSRTRGSTSCTNLRRALPFRQPTS